ncbi:MAG: hypothetical protein WBY71_01060, partial [Nitrososphaeraceae archaeon]
LLSARKIVIKAFGSIFYHVLHYSFYNDALLIRGMDMMRLPQKLASLWMDTKYLHLWKLDGC